MPSASPPADPLGDGWREQVGRARVASGQVHPYFADVGRELLRSWDVEKVVKDRGVDGYIAHLLENLVAFTRVWKDIAESYGTGNTGVLDGSSERLRELSGLPDGPARDALKAAEIDRQLRPAFSKDRVTLVRVTQDIDGRFVSVDLVSPSNDASMDRAAVDAARQAAQNLPPPPEEARGSRKQLISLWAFELEVSISPPAPIIGIEFDAQLGIADLRLPLDRRVWKQVKLVATY